jgi:hypothetical protein
LVNQYYDARQVLLQNNFYWRLNCALNMAHQGHIDKVADKVVIGTIQTSVSLATSTSH